MVGVTYSDLKEGDRCWIAVGDAHSRLFFEGEFKEYLPDSSPLVLELREKISNYSIRGARAAIVDPRTQGIEPGPMRSVLPYRQEPLCNYAILPRSGELDQIIRDFNALQKQLASERYERQIEKQTLTELLLSRAGRQQAAFPRKI